MIAGTIGSETEPIEARNLGDNDKVAAAGIFGSGSNGKRNDSYPSTSQPPGSTVPALPPTTDENLVYGMFSQTQFHAVFLLLKSFFSSI